MRRLTLVLVCMALMVGTLAAAAYALEAIVGTTHNDYLLESPQDDLIMGLAGDDVLDASLYPEDAEAEGSIQDKDVLRGGSDNDVLDAADGLGPASRETGDTLNGGSGYEDRCYGDSNDTFINCEVINGIPQVA